MSQSQQIAAQKLTSGNATVDAFHHLGFDGNIVPRSWYQHPDLKLPSGKPNLVAITLLSDIIYWYRPTIVCNEVTGKVISMNRKFSYHRMFKDYRQWADQFGLTKRQVQDAISFLVSKGLIVREIALTFRFDSGYMGNNVTFFEPIEAAIRELNEIRAITLESDPYGLPLEAEDISPSDELFSADQKQGVTLKRDSPLDETEAPQLSNVSPLPLKRDSYTKTTEETTLETKSEIIQKGKVEQVQHQQQHAARVQIVDAVVENESSIPTATPQTPATPTARPKSKTPAREIEPQPKLPATAVASAAATPTAATVRESLIARLEALRGQKALLPQIAELEHSSGQSWAQLAAQLAESWPVAEMGDSELRALLQQEPETVGLDDPIANGRVRELLRGDRADLLWELAIWSARQVHPGAHSLTSCFLSRLPNADLLRPDALGRLIEPLWAPIRAAQSEKRAAAKTVRPVESLSQNQSRAPQLSDADLEAAQDAYNRNETARSHEVTQIILAEIEADERTEWEAESRRSVDGFHRDFAIQQYKLDPNSPEFAVHIESAYAENLRSIAQHEYKPRFNELMDELRDRDDAAPLALAA